MLSFEKYVDRDDGEKDGNGEKEERRQDAGLSAEDCS